MDDQMSSYPEPDSQQHYTLYPAPGQQQLLDPAQQEQLQFSQLGQLGQAIYPKAEGEIDPNAPNHIEQRIEQLQQQPPHPQPQHQHQHPLQHHEQHHDQHQHQQAPLAPPPPPPTAQPQGPQVQGETPQKANRLRKACDSCSIRKVKVRQTRATSRRVLQLISTLSVMNPARHAERALPLTYPAPSSVLVAAVVRRTVTQKQSSVAASRSRLTSVASPRPHLLPTPLKP